MATVFIPPTAPLVPPTVNPRHPGSQLFRHYRPWSAGLNVFLLKDGTVTQAEPYGQDGIRRTFHGGHIHPVTDAEAALLVAAGYTVTTVPDPVTAPGLPSGDFTSPPVSPPVVGDLLDTYDDTYSDSYGTGSAPSVTDTYTANYAEAY